MDTKRFQTRSTPAASSGWEEGEAVGWAPGSTFLCRVDDRHGAEGPFPLVVVHPDFNFVGWEGRQGLVAEDVSGGVRGGHDGLHPADGAEGAESHHVPEAASVLQLLGHCLWAGRTWETALSATAHVYLPICVLAVASWSFWSYCPKASVRNGRWLESCFASNLNSSHPIPGTALLLRELPVVRGEQHLQKTLRPRLSSPL